MKSVQNYYIAISIQEVKEKKHFLSHWIIFELWHITVACIIVGILCFLWSYHLNFLSPLLLFTIRFFSNKSANCCTPAKKARSQKTRVKTDTRISCHVRLATSCHFLSLTFLWKEWHKQTADRGPCGAQRCYFDSIKAIAQLGSACDLRQLQVFHCTLITAWIIFPVDTTRVEIMETDSDLPGSDYINANYIRVSWFGVTPGFTFANRARSVATSDLLIEYTCEYTFKLKYFVLNK